MRKQKETIMNLNTTIKRHSAASFIVLTLGLSYAAFALPVSGESALLAILCVLVIVPTLVAIGLAAFVDGRRGAGAFLRECFRWRAPLTWYVSAIAIGFLIQFGSSVLALLTGRIPAIEFRAPVAILIAFVLFALLEEIGWRGFALRRLLDRYSPFTATLMVGIAWGLVHFGLTLFLMPDRSPVAGGLAVLAAAFPHTWIFIKSGRNVLVATVLHFVFNAAGSVVGPARVIGEPEALLFFAASTCLTAAAFILIDRRMWFARPVGTHAGESGLSASRVELVRP
jgi:membrane protease YdiL (CAAX protease family)